MAGQRLSPTGNLFRNSRLFSLPPPLSRLSDKVTSTRRYDSETATLPYPTQQALETTPSSLARGDWGLKRSLPLKSTARTSTPTIKIKDIDSIDHITDFDSAADHVLNLRKWQEIGLPVTRDDAPPKVFHGRGETQPLKAHKSVFESEYDNTQRASDNPEQTRWKYRGPWIAGQTAGEFKEYTERKVRGRERQFRHFLLERLREKMAAADRRAAIDGGLPISEESPYISDLELERHIKELRQDQQGRLFEYIEEFLDLPRGPRGDGKWDSAKSERGPPITHPSAGLSYLRVPSHTLNHPALGPQVLEQPVRARILATREAVKAKATPTIGIAGVAVEDDRIKNSVGDDRIQNSVRGGGLSRGVPTFDQDVAGGAKIWIQPQRIMVDSQGKIKVKAIRADPKTTALYVPGEQEEPFEDPLGKADRRIPELTNERRNKPNTGISYGYGVNGNDFEPRRAPRRSDKPIPPFPKDEGFANLLNLISKE